MNLVLQSIGACVKNAEAAHTAINAAINAMKEQQL